MAIVFMQKVFDGSISGTNDFYTSAEFNAIMGQAEKLLVQVRAAQTTSGALLDLDIEHSNDNVNFKPKYDTGTPWWNDLALTVNTTINQLNEAAPRRVACSPRGAMQ